MAVLNDISQEHPSSPDYVYDVFISFRGTDTRYAFTDHLHKALLDATINTFLDDAGIQTGEELKPELESAIKSSRASVIVLSKDYASSTWCLDELVLILEQRRTCKHIVFPIFYNIKPIHARKQQSSFGDAMARHKQRIEDETNLEEKRRFAHKMEQWEKALAQVADIKGEEANGRRETILIEEIVKEISSRLELHKRSKIPHLIGMKYSIRTITSFLKEESSEILTIWGMAGIGKTYLADYIFKLHHLEFERSCFLEDVERKCTQPNALLDLQKQLLKDIRDGTWMDIQVTDVGTSKIETSLLRRRTLLVLDGIDQVEQLNVLIGTKGLHPGTKIIITSKNESLTGKCRLFDTEYPPKHMKHLLKGLDEKESLELLSWHAFGPNDDKEGDEKDSMTKIVEYCKGHPLALKVLGSSFRNEDATWEDILESLGKEVNPNIQKVLQISFDSLPNEKDKELFKHIACFFVGEDKDVIERVLKASGICKPSGVKNLVNRCLVTIGQFNELVMHQLLQEMGREVVRQESPNKAWKRSLLWHHEECLDVLQNSKGTRKIQGFVLDMKTIQNETSNGSSGVKKMNFGDDSYYNFRSFPLLHWVRAVIWWLFGWVSGLRSSFRRQKGGFETHTFKKMCNLRILHLNYVQLNGSYKNFPEGLRFLCMHGFPLSYIPSDLQMENMVALDMSNSNLRQLWRKPKLLKSLRFLNLSCCRELVSVAHFSRLPLLETLILAGCSSLIEICESIGNCDRLVHLDMSECKKLKKVPISIGKLKKLTTLSVDDCSNLEELPVVLEVTDSLEVVETNNINVESQVCSSGIMEAIPKSSLSFVISLPKSLVSLSLKNNNLCNEAFPMNLGSLAMLKKLDLSKNPIDSLPDCVRSLSKLEVLYLTECRRLKTALGIPSTIVDLFATECDSLEKITFYPEPSTPPNVYCAFSKYSLNEVQGWFKIQAIAQVDEDILHSLGWTNIQDVKYLQQRVTFDGHQGEMRPVQMLYEYGIFSTYFHGEKVPNWITHRTNGSSISINIPSSPKGYRIRGLNVCIVMNVSFLWFFCKPGLLIKNLTKNWFRVYNPKMYATPKDEDEEVIVWLSHWTFGNNMFEDGDEVSVHWYYFYFYDDDTDAKECGISLVYDHGNKNGDPLACCKSTYHIACQDLSTFPPSDRYTPQLEKW